MIDPAAFYASLQRHGLAFFTGVPDSLLKDLCAYINDHVPPSRHVINANEGAAVALAAGYHVATGNLPVVYLQNSGTGNAINPLLSPADPAVYAIPMLLIIGWRGEPGVKDEPQHVTHGRIQEQLLDAIETPYDVIGAASTDFDEVIGRAVDSMKNEARPRALLVRSGTFATYSPSRRQQSLTSLLRLDAISAVLTCLDKESVVVSTTGMTSREVFHLRELRNEGHAQDFLTVGSMGHSSQIALGIAKEHPRRTVVCLDGDGATLMHLGSLAIIGTQAPPNYRHVVINNGAHDSVGGQPTAASSVDIGAIVRACGYRSSAVADSTEDVEAAWASLGSQPGPTLLEIRVASHARTDAGRPTSAPAENKAVLMDALMRSDA